MKPAVYLDHNATAPVRPAAAEAVARAFALTGNVSSVHRFGRVVRRLVEDARDAVAALVGADAADIVFTSGGTEANNLALRGCGRRVLVSAVEHDSVLKAIAGAEVVPVDGEGVIDIEALDALLAAGDVPTLVSVMLANNETGVVQPVAALAATARRHGALVHCDAVQAAGKIAFDMDTLGVDMLSLSAHKIGGPPGVGALVVGNGTALEPQAVGGGQERGLRAGTVNAPGISGFGAAAEKAHEGLADFAALAELRDGMETRARRTVPATRIFGAGAQRLPNTSCLTMPGISGETQVMALDLDGVAISAGAACSSGKAHAGHVLEAMGVEPAEGACAIRVSLGWTTTEADIVRFENSWTKLHAASGTGKASAA